jgi:hypothetical protein
MAGVPPAKEMVSWSDKLPPEARYVFERLWKAYFQGAGVYKQPELNSADFQKMLHGIDANDFRAPTIVPARGAIRRQNMLIAPSAELMRKRLERVRVSREELHRWIAAMGIKSAYSFAPVATSSVGAEPDTQTGTPTPELTPAPAINWRPKPSIERAPGYRWPLYQYLKRAHTAGTAKPKARDFLDDLSNHPHPDLEAMPDGLKYNDGLGNPKEANLRAIQAAIAGLVMAQ